MSRPSLKQIAYNTIKEKILSCEYEPSSFFNEEALCEELQMSRTPVRDALSRMEQENLIQIVPKKGFFIAPMSVSYTHLDVYKRQITSITSKIFSFAIALVSLTLASGQLPPSTATEVVIVRFGAMISWLTYSSPFAHLFPSTERICLPSASTVISHPFGQIMHVYVFFIPPSPPIRPGPESPPH